MNLRYALIALPAACVSGPAFSECTPAQIQSPARGSTVQDARPEIRWAAAAGAETYRVQIESRVPEGRVIERVDARVSGTRFVPPRPLTDRRAAVKLLVTANCPESANVSPQAAWFFVDAASRCAAVRGLALSDAGAPRAAWSRAERATGYEVETYSLSDGRLISRRETTLPSADLPRASAPLVVAVRPRCGPLAGEAAYGLLSASR